MKIGFDFDGVLVYNPLRIGRLPVSYFKKKFFKPKKLQFWYPEKPWERAFWSLAHKTSVFPANGYNRLLNLLKKGAIEGYVITARFDFLKNDFKNWFAKHDPEKLFSDYFLNEKNEQPHLFKERMIKKLGLDFFVEDNWDIVNYLNSSLDNSSSKLKVQSSKFKPKNRKTEKQKNRKLLQATSCQLPATQIHWIYNILDRGIEYPRKHPYLGRFLESLKI